MSSHRPRAVSDTRLVETAGVEIPLDDHVT